MSTTSATWRYSRPPAQPISSIATPEPVPDGATLNCRLDFSNVVYNGGDQKLASFAFQVPTSDVALDLATVERVTV